MSIRQNKFFLPLLLILGVLFVDQLLKIYIKLNFVLGEEYKVAGDWFIIHFTENPGMAFGMEFGGDYGKLFLSSFRIVAAIIGIWYIRKIILEAQPKGYIAAVCLIFAGAVGNILDSVFYGYLFSESNFQLAEFMPAEGGYAGWLHGKVVDMFYFPLINGTFPDWFPIWGGEPFQFFRPVFNLADASISTGVGMILVFQKRFFPETKEQDSKKTTRAESESSETIPQTKTSEENNS